LGENEVNKLYQDAIYWHLIGKGYPEFEARVEAKRRVRERNKI